MLEKHYINKYFNGHRLTKQVDVPEPDPYNPLNLPQYTIRLLYKDGVTPTFSKGTGVQVSSSPNVWDLTYVDMDWSNLLDGHEDLLEVLGANTSDVGHMFQMFNECSSLTTVSLFDTSYVGNMVAMFFNCASLTSVPLFDTSSVGNMNHMFYGCSSLTSVPLFDTSLVQYMTAMFYTCSSLTTVPLFDTGNVTNMRSMFAHCSSLQSAPLFNTSNVTTMERMFFSCLSLKLVPLFDTSSVADTREMFAICRQVESGALAFYSQAYLQSVSQYRDTFSECGIDTPTGLAELQQIPKSWGGLH